MFWPPTDEQWTLVPPHMRGTVRRYVEEGIAGGSFFNAVVCNDLKGAFARADHINRYALPQIVEFMVWYMPSECQGHPDTVIEWIDGGGLSGRKEMADILRQTREREVGDAGT